jgi:3D (Asp-Asp-Asp) domain-containing protein
MTKYIAIMSLLGGFTPLLAATPGIPMPIITELSYELTSDQSAFIAHSGDLGYRVGRPKTHEAYCNVVATGYSSTPEETDDTPFITASGKVVSPGTVAMNWLPLGTTIRIPKLFGDRIFVVEDRMNERYHDNVDIWFANKSDAQKFGLRHTCIEVI